MKNNRELIVEFIQKNRITSVVELSKSLLVTRADIRYHLKQLLAEKVVEIAAVDRRVRKGRPTHYYQIALEAQPNNFLQIADILLDLHSAPASNGGDLAEILASAISQKISPAKQHIRQLNQLIRFLNDHGYRAGWEAHSSGPRILFRNCPYSEIIKRHPELCKMDRIILEKYLNFNFEQIQKIDRESGKMAPCIFVVTNGKTGK